MKKRVSLTLSDGEYQVLKDYSDLLKTTPTTVIYELFNEVFPTFKLLVDASKEADVDKRNTLLKLQFTLLNGIHNAAGVSAEIQKELNL